MSTLLNIAAVSRRTRVAPDTLRKWEQRYGVVRPQRTAGGQRRYTEQDVARVEWLRDRLGEGWRISEAARVLDAAPAAPLSEPAALRAALVDAARGGHTGTVPALLDQALAVLPLAEALEQVVVPALRAIGDEWHRGTVTVAGEHAVSGQVRARLDLLLADPRGSARGTAILACAPDERHELGLLMLAVLLRADGWHVGYLGQDTPVAATISYAERLDADLVCFTAARDETRDALAAGLAEIADLDRTVVVGGAAVRRDWARRVGAVYAGDRLADAVPRLRELAAA